MSDNKVPEKMRDIYDAIVALTDQICGQHLSQEYVDLSRKMAATLARKRPSPLASGRAKTWAAGIVYALGQINFLFDKTQTPYISARDLCALFDVSQNSASAKAKQIRNALRIHLLDHNWLRPSQLAEHTAVWLVSVNGYIVDIRSMPRYIQEKAYLKGIIPYVPADRGE
ncbi:MAG: hypothetical protein JNM70_07065 [Anaerolineae bacterium]|nr:hypothetical protein [Anaerolineae bacterium]